MNQPTAPFHLVTPRSFGKAKPIRQAELRVSLGQFDEAWFHFQAA